MTIDAGRTEILETEAKFLTRFTIDEEEDIVNASNGTTIAVANVVVDDITKAGRSGDRDLVAILFWESSGFATGCNGITAGVSN